MTFILQKRYLEVKNAISEERLICFVVKMEEAMSTYRL